MLITKEVRSTETKYLTRRILDHVEYYYNLGWLFEELARDESEKNGKIEHVVTLRFSK